MRLGESYNTDRQFAKWYLHISSSLYECTVMFCEFLDILLSSFARICCCGHVIRCYDAAFMAGLVRQHTATNSTTSIFSLDF